ncbi:MAG: DUF433 domain-containing protein [Thermoanaerobaculia bacterium]
MWRETVRMDILRDVGTPFRYAQDRSGVVEVPRYSIPEAARYLRMSPATLKSWVAGRSYDTVKGGPRWWDHLIHRPDPNDPRLSFANLTEAFVLQALRKQYKVKMKEVRVALDCAHRKLGVDRILLSKDLRALRGGIFLRHLDTLINVGKGGQTAIPEILGAYLERVEWDDRDLPLRMFPFTRAEGLHSPKLLTINPEIAFGRPVIERKSIRTSSIAERFEAGESIASLAEDYDLEVAEVEEAIRYEALPIAA